MLSFHDTDDIFDDTGDDQRGWDGGSGTVRQGMFLFDF